MSCFIQSSVKLFLSALSFSVNLCLYGLFCTLFLSHQVWKIWDTICLGLWVLETATAGGLKLCLDLQAQYSTVATPLLLWTRCKRCCNHYWRRSIWHDERVELSAMPNVAAPQVQYFFGWPCSVMLIADAPPSLTHTCMTSVYWTTSGTRDVRLGWGVPPRHPLLRKILCASVLATTYQTLPLHTPLTSRT